MLHRNEVRLKICETAKILFDASLLTLSGGNISCRVGGMMFITPRYSAEKFKWRLKPREICEIRMGKALEEVPKPASRESRLHLAIYETYEGVNALIHSHEKNLMGYALAGKSPSLFGEIARLLGGSLPISGEEVPGSGELARAVVSSLLTKFSADARSLAVIVGGHGVVVGADDLGSAGSILCALSEYAYAEIVKEHFQSR